MFLKNHLYNLDDGILSRDDIALCVIDLLLDGGRGLAGLPSDGGLTALPISSLHASTLSEKSFYFQNPIYLTDVAQKNPLLCALLFAKFKARDIT